jgi:FkbM family methyltransferase
MKNIKRLLKKTLINNGYLVFNTKNIPWGIDLETDIYRIIGSKKITTLFDIGAHHGFFTKNFANNFQVDEVYAYEPVTENFSQLTVNLSSLPGKVRCNQKAISNSDGFAEIELRGHSQWHTLRRQNSPAISDKCEKVTLSTIDIEIKKYDLKVIDFLKIDTEGFEIEVLEGAKAALQGKRVKFIFIESTLIEKSEIHTHMDKIKSELLNYDYKLVAIYDQMIFPKFRQGFFNALFTSL